MNYFKFCYSKIMVYLPLNLKSPLFPLCFPNKTLRIPLPKWVLEEINKDPDLAYSDRFGRRNSEYITLGCDTLPVLRGRSPIQAYADFMRNFRDTFRPYLGAIITVNTALSAKLKFQTVF